MRIDPALPVQMVKTYGIDAPLATHWRKATCVEVSCKAHTDGWITMIPESMIPESPIDMIGATGADASTAVHKANLRRLKDQDEARAYYIRHLSGREFTDHIDESGITVFDFPPDQDCFEGHKIRIDRPEIFEVRGGDWRGNPTRESRIHDRPDDWVEDFALHQDEIATRIERG